MRRPVLALLLVAAACSSTTNTGTRNEPSRAESEIVPSAGIPKVDATLVPGDAAGRVRTSVAKPRAATQTVERTRRLAVDNRPLKIGWVINTGSEQSIPGAAKFAVDADKQKRLVNAMIAHVNATGGFAGRKVTVKIREKDTTDGSSSNQERIEDANCTGFAQDDKAFMVIAEGSGAWRSPLCYAKYRLPVLPQVTQNDNKLYQLSRPWTLPTFWMNMSRMARLLPQVLAEQKFLTKKMGVVTLDQGTHRRSAQIELIPGIERRGGKVLHTQFIDGTKYDGIFAGVASAVLQFKALGVDRVVMWWPGGGGWQLIATQAETQDYHPRYGISTFDSPQAVGTLIPAGQLRGTVGAGYWTWLDQSLSRQAAPNAREKACWAIYKKRAGVTYSSRNDESNGALATCDMVFLTQTALKPATGKALTQAMVPRLFNSTGDRYRPIGFVKSRLADSRADAILSYKPFAYKDDCSCFDYTVKAWRDIPF